MRYRAPFSVPKLSTFESRIDAWLTLKGVLVIVAAAWLLTPGDRDERNGVSSKEETTRHILTDRSTREVGIDQLTASVEMMSRETTDLKRRVEALSRRQDG